MVGFSRAGYSSVGRGDDDDEAGRGLPLPVTTPGSSWRSSSDAAPTYPPPPPSSLSARSSKDKGKARAVPLPSGHTVENNSTAAADAESTQPPAMGMYFSIRFTDGSPDLLDMYVSAHESVRDVKQRIHYLKPMPSSDGDATPQPPRPRQRRRLRLIQLGRLMTDGTRLVPYTRQLMERREKLAGWTATSSSAAAAAAAAAEEVLDSLVDVVSRTSGAGSGAATTRRGSVCDSASGKGKGKEKEKGQEKDLEMGLGEQATAEPPKQESVWLQCAVGEPIEEEEDSTAAADATAGGKTADGAASDDKEQEQLQQIVPLQGFDRLRDAGFSDEDIENMRTEFRRSRAGASVAAASNVNVEDEDEHARALEDQWMEGLTGQDEAAAAADLARQDRYWTTMLQGVCIGFFVPFLPWFFFRAQMFSRTMSIAIVLGAFINVMFGLLRIFS